MPKDAEREEDEGYRGGRARLHGRGKARRYWSNIAGSFRVKFKQFQPKNFRFFLQAIIPSKEDNHYR